MPELLFESKDVHAYFIKQSKQVKEAMLYLRNLIYSVSRHSDLIGEIEETLKWGEPSYINGLPRTGTTLRLAPTGNSEHELGLFVHCQTSLIDSFKEMHPTLDYQGNRCLLLDINNLPDQTIIEHFVFLAMTYHYQKRQHSLV